MAGLQRSSISFRRQGSSGIVWDDKLLSLINQKEQDSSTTEAAPDNSTAADNSATSDGGSGKGRAALPQEQELVKTEQKQEVKEDHHNLVVKVERSRSSGRAAFRTGKVSPAIEPPSPKVSACGFCGAFGKYEKTHRRGRAKPGMLKI